MKGIQATTFLIGVLLASQSFAAEPNASDAYQIKKHHATGNTSFLKSANKQNLKIKNLNIQALDRAVINQFSGAFGVNDTHNEMRTLKQKTSSNNHTHIRYQQHYKGIPVIGAELVANVDAAQQLSSISGETSVALNINTQATLSANDASRLAIKLVANLYKLDATTLTAKTPALSIYDAKLIGPGQFPAALVWRTEITAGQTQGIRELVLIDANNGIVHLNFNQVDTALSRLIYTANNTPVNQVVFPGTLVCDETTACTNDIDAEIAKLYSGYTYKFYLDNHQRDSYDNKGADIISTVHIGVNFKNAFWDGKQMGFGDGFSRSIDVVAHEITHAMTETESNLFYHHQSGAINESFSDVWAEFIDQTNIANAQKWLIGDELARLGTIPGPIRNMMDPEAPPFNDPAKMTSAKYYAGLDDYGGVHINSGINNKAVYLMTDGGSFNGITVTALGITKVAKIYYEVQTKLLTAGANYADLYNALIQACSNLSGQAASGIVTADCTQVKAAIDAVEMNLEPVTTTQPKLAALCTQGLNTQDIFLDDFESGLNNWTVPKDIVYGLKTVSPWLIKSNNKNNLFWGVGYPGVNDFSASMNTDITVPATGNTYLHFTHQYFFETYVSTDRLGKELLESQSGAVIEYSTDTGTTWTDAGSLIKTGLTYEPGKTIVTASQNPLAGRAGFIEQRYKVNSSRLDLSTLAGKSVRFRWRIGTEGFTGSTGWFIDDVRIYQCSNQAVGVNPIIRGIQDRVVNESSSVTLDASKSTDPKSQTLSFVWTQTAGTEVLNLSKNNSAKLSFMVPKSNTSLVFKLVVSNTSGGSSTKSVTLKVNKNPTADAGPRVIAKLGSNVSITGTGTDSETLASNLSFQWTQLSGTTVSLSNANTAKVGFVAPKEAYTIKLQLKVSDADSGSSTDTVEISDSNTATTTGKKNDSRSGGCVLLASSTFDPVLLLLALVFVLSLFRKKIALNFRKK